MSANAYTTIRIWEKTRRKLRVLSAYVGKPLVRVLDELADRALSDVTGEGVEPAVKEKAKE